MVGPWLPIRLCCVRAPTRQSFSWTVPRIGHRFTQRIALSLRLSEKRSLRWTMDGYSYCRRCPLRFRRIQLREVLYTATVPCRNLLQRQNHITDGKKQGHAVGVFHQIRMAFSSFGANGFSETRRTILKLDRSCPRHRRRLTTINGMCQLPYETTCGSRTRQYWGSWEKESSSTSSGFAGMWQKAELLDPALVKWLTNIL